MIPTYADVTTREAHLACINNPRGLSPELTKKPTDSGARTRDLVCNLSYDALPTELSYPDKRVGALARLK